MARLQTVVVAGTLVALLGGSPVAGKQQHVLQLLGFIQGRGTLVPSTLDAHRVRTDKGPVPGSYTYTVPYV